MSTLARFVYLPASVAVALILGTLSAPTPVAAVTAGGHAATEAAGEGAPVVVVEFHHGTGLPARLAALAARGLRLVEDLPGSDFVLAEPDGAAPSARASASTADDAIAGTAPPVPVRASAPDDPLIPLQWHLAAVQAPSAWARSPGAGAGAVVAVLDTGVSRDAPDFAPTSFVPGLDAVDGDGDPDDRNGHGTHVAGVVAQAAGNGVGGAGLAHGATLMPVRVLDDGGQGIDFHVAVGLRWAADNGADVANLSLGSAGHSAVLAEAVEYATGRGVVVVAASGNGARGEVDYPAAYHGVIAVGAVRFDLARAPYSNTGTALDLVAPGGDLRVDQNGDGYLDGILAQSRAPGPAGGWCFCYVQGTSVAAPQVSATAALLVGAGATSAAQVREVLLETARDLGPTGWDAEYGTGLVQARDALAWLARKQTSAPPPAARTIDLACPVDRVPAGSFADVPAGSVHGRAVDCIAWWGVTGGRSDGTYGPAEAVTRGQMASFLARTVAATGRALPASPPDAFPDDAGSIHEHSIDQLALLGILLGREDGSFGPLDPVRRGELASFLVRTHDLVAPAPLPAPSDPFFDDDGTAHEASIGRAAEAGLASGTAPGRFDPGGALRRDQMASFLARTLDLLVETGASPPR